MDRRTLLSVDPGTHSAWALWREVADGRWDLTRVGREKAPSARECVALLRELGVSGPEAHLVVEGQFYSPKRGFSPWNDVALLIELRCRWLAAAELLEATTEVVTPGLWIPAMTKGAPGADSKARIRWVCGMLLPGVPLAGDEHDAALLGAWWVRRSGGIVAARHLAAEKEV